MTEYYRGGCLCGTVRYEARGAARDLCLCHCTSCRRAAGATAVAWGTLDASAFVVTHGKLRERHSSPEVLRGFCADCGTTISYRHERKPNEIDFALATLDDPELLAPECHLWIEDKPSWVSIDDRLPQYARGRSDAERPAHGARALRPGYAAVSARIVVHDVAGLVDFIKQVFDASGYYVQGVPSELRIGNSTLLISEPGARAAATAFLYVYVADVADTHARALRLGARELEAPLDTPYGDQRSMLEDAWGNTWQIARYHGPRANK